MSTDAPTTDRPLSPRASLADGEPTGPTAAEMIGSGATANEVSPARLSAEGAVGYPALPHTLELLLDVRINVSVEVGRVQMPVRQVMELGPGAVIELERSASEPVEIHANGRCIGRGEIVVVGEQFGVRVTELG